MLLFEYYFIYIDHNIITLSFKFYYFLYFHNILFCDIDNEGTDINIVIT